MLPAAMGERLDALIDDLIMDGGVEAASLASILLAAKDSMNSNRLVTLSRRVWSESNDLKDECEAEDDPRHLVVDEVESAGAEGMTSASWCEAL